MSKRLKAELWEIQIILYLILATQLDTEWLRWIIYVWCVITFIGAIKMLVEERIKERTNLEKESI